MKTQNTNWNYLLKHWLFTLLLGPFILQIIIFTNSSSHQVFNILEIYPVVVIISFIFSIPTYIIYAFVYNYCSNLNSSILYTKAILISISVIGVFVTMILIGGTISNDMAISYSISSIITGLFFKLNFKNEEEL